MKKNKMIIAMLISVFFIVGLSGCGLISKTPEAEKKTAIASVNGENVTRDDFQKRLEPLEKQYEEQYGADFFTKQPTYLTTVKDQLLQTMIQEKVMLQKAAELKMVITDKTVNAEVDKEIAATVKNFGGEKTYEAQLKAAKLTPAGYKASLQTEYKTNLTLQKLFSTITASAKVTDQEVINYYYTNQYNYTEKPDTINVSHILVKTDAEALKIFKEIKAGMKFTDAAKKYSTDAANKATGGLLGDIVYTSTDYDKDFLAGAIATPTGKVSMPVKSAAGYHLIKINTRHEYKLKPLDKVKADIKKTLLDSKQKDLFNAAYATWEKAAKIVQHPELMP